MFGLAFILYILFFLGYGIFLWAVFWHLRAYRLPGSAHDRLSNSILAAIGILFFISLFLFFQVPWQSYSLFPSVLP